MGTIPCIAKLLVLKRLSDSALPVLDHQVVMIVKIVAKMIVASNIHTNVMVSHFRRAILWVQTNLLVFSVYSRAKSGAPQKMPRISGRLRINMLIKLNPPLGNAGLRFISQPDCRI